MQVVQQLNDERWRDFVAKTPDGNVFHTPEMFQVLAQTKGYNPTLWATTDDAGEIFALFIPVQITLMNGVLHRFTTRAVAYGSVLSAPGPKGEEALRRLLQTYTQKSNGTVLFTELRNLSNLQPVQATLNQSGFLYEDHLNYLINLRRPQEAIWKGIKGRTRSYIRRGLREGALTIQAAERPEQVAACYDLLCQTYQHAQLPLADYSLFEGVFNLLCKHNMARITLVYMEKTPVAASVDLLYKGVIYYWYGGMDRAFGSHHPNELLRWHILQWGMEHGYELFDFGGAGKPDDIYRVRDFKAKFGGELVSLGRNIYVHRPHVLRLSTFAYHLSRRFLCDTPFKVKS